MDSPRALGGRGHGVMRQLLKQRSVRQKDIFKNSQSGPMHSLRKSTLGGKSRHCYRLKQLVLCLVGAFVPIRGEGGREKTVSILKEADKCRRHGRRCP